VVKQGKGVANKVALLAALQRSDHLLVALLCRYNQAVGVGVGALAFASQKQLYAPAPFHIPCSFSAAVEAKQTSYACREVQPLSSYGGMLALCTLPDRGVLLHRLSAPRLEGAQAGVCVDCKSHRGLSCPLALRVTT
jgi:hypothetical protein